MQNGTSKASILCQDCKEGYDGHIPVCDEEEAGKGYDQIGSIRWVKGSTSVSIDTVREGWGILGKYIEKVRIQTVRPIVSAEEVWPQMESVVSPQKTSQSTNRTVRAIEVISYQSCEQCGYWYSSEISSAKESNSLGHP